MDLTEGVGESSSPPRSFGSFSNHDLRNNVYNRFIESGHDEAVSNPELFREHLDSHFNRLPASYGLDVNIDKVEDVLLHQKLLAMAKDPEKRPVYHIRFLEEAPKDCYGIRVMEKAGYPAFDYFTHRPQRLTQNRILRQLFMRK